MLTKLVLIIAASGAALIGWNPAVAPQEAPSASPSCCETAQLVSVTAPSKLDLIKRLEGTWVSLDENGEPTDTVVSVYRVTAGGSVVLETLFPGSEHEMLSIYHMDGEALVMTHYCVMKNQPRMRATPESNDKKIVFKAFEVTNAKSDADPAMRQGTVWFEGSNRMKSEWLMTMGEKTIETVVTQLQRLPKEAK